MHSTSAAPHRPLFVLTAIACAIFLAASNASAQITFTLNNVSLIVPGTTTAAGTLSGTFTTTSNVLNSSTQLLSWNISATSTTGLSHNFASFNYNLSDSTAYYNVGSSGLLTGFELDSPLGSNTASQVDSIRFFFSNNLSTTGTDALGTSGMTISYESEHNSGGNRNVSAGSVSAVPEPSAWVLGCAALVLFGGLRLRNRTTRPVLID